MFRVLSPFWNSWIRDNLHTKIRAHVVTFSNVWRLVVDPKKEITRDGHFLARKVLFLVFLR